METSIDYTDNVRAYVSTDERRTISLMRRLKEKYPDDVEILDEPETNDGCLNGRVPVKWIKIVPPRQVTMTDERKQELRERLAAARSRKQKT